jgi:hypothetical protein
MTTNAAAPTNAFAPGIASQGQIALPAAATEQVWALIRKTDVFVSIATGAADGIEKQAAERRALAVSLRSNEVVSAVRDAKTEAQLANAAQQIEQQAGAEARIATWLRELARDQESA